MLWEQKKEGQLNELFDFEAFGCFQSSFDERILIILRKYNVRNIKRAKSSKRATSGRSHDQFKRFNTVFEGRSHP